MAKKKTEWIKVHARDNVATLLEPHGKIPAGHKVALVDIAAGQAVVKYGEAIGRATHDIDAGSWVHDHNLASSLTRDLDLDVKLRPPTPKPEAKMPATFQGYRQTDGRVGIRNDLFILPTVGCVAKTAEKLKAQAQIQAEALLNVDGVIALTHPLGCSQLGRDHENTRLTLANLARNGNAGGVLVLGLGCENNQLDAFRQEFSEKERAKMRFLECQKVEDELAAGQAMIGELLAMMSKKKRESCPIEALTVGLKCGGSDAFSGLSANPLLGRFSESFIAAGGRCLLGEIPEFFGAEPVLLPRCQNEAVALKLRSLLQSFRDEYASRNLPVHENPSPGNKEGGLSTLEEKSLGCVQKAGRTPVSDVIDHGQRAKEAGLTVVETPGNDLISCTALAAAGAQLILFTTGRGTPWGGPVPTLKIASNASLASRKPHWIDFDASPALQGLRPTHALDADFSSLIFSVFEGRPTQNEKNDYREIALYKQGATL